MSARPLRPRWAKDLAPLGPTLQPLPQNIPQGGNISEYAKKYEPLHPGWVHSSITPISPFFPTGNMPQQDPFKTYLERVQMVNFDGFSAQDLVDLGCNVTVSDAFASGNLSNPVIPAFQRHRWQTRPERHFTPPPIPSELGGGHWLATDDRVWNVVEPSLKIASMILMNSFSHPFMHAIIHGQRQNVRPDELPAGAAPHVRYQRFFPTRMSFDPTKIGILRETIRRIIENLQQYIEMVGFKPIEDNTDDYNAICKGFLNPMHRDGSGECPMFFIFLDSHYYEPLLRSNTTDAERLAYSSFMAHILVHECGHAILRLAEYYMDKQPQNNIYRGGEQHEPYYMQDPIAECGFALEREILGATVDQKGFHLRGGKPFPIVCIQWQNWPALKYSQYNGNVALRHPPLEPTTFYAPIPIQYYEDIQQQQFWNVAVKKFGLNLFELRGQSVRTEVDWRYTTLDRKNLKNARQPLVQKLNDLKQQGLRDPEDREAWDLARRLYDRSSNWASLWDQGAEQIRQLNDAINKFQHAAHGGNNVIAEQDQLDMLTTLVENHAQCVDTFTKIEGANAVQRRNLYKFNRGLRGWCISIASGWTILPESFDPLDIKLEHCHHILVDPNDANVARDYPDDHTELQQLEEAIQALNRNDTDAFEVIVDNATNREMSYFCASSFTGLALAAGDLYPDSTIAQRIASIKNEIGSLIQLRDGPNHNPVQTWYPTIDHMVRTLTDMMLQLDRSTTPAPPGPVGPSPVPPGQDPANPLIRNYCRR